MNYFTFVVPETDKSDKCRLEMGEAVRRKKGSHLMQWQPQRDGERLDLEVELDGGEGPHKTPICYNVHNQNLFHTISSFLLLCHDILR